MSLCRKWSWTGILRFACLVMLTVGSIVATPRDASADDEFERVRRIYIEGARFMQEGRYDDAVPMLNQAYTMLSRAVKKGSKNKRSIRALRKLRYFLGFSLYKVGATKATSTNKEDKAFTRAKYTQAVPLLAKYSKDGKSEKRRKEAAKLLVLAKAWLVKNPPPPKKIKTKVIMVGSKKGRLRAWPFIVIGVGVLVAGAGAVTAGLTLNSVGQRDDVHQTLSAGNDPSSAEVARLHRQAQTFATVSYVLWGVGGAIAVTGVILAATMGRAPPPKTPLPAKTTGKSNATMLWKGGMP